MCEDERASCLKCEYALKEDGIPTGCLLENEKMDLNELAYKEYLIWKLY